MSIHRENALKAHQHHILFYTCHLKKNNFNTKSDQNIHQDVSNCNFFFNSRRVACPLACVQLISLFLYERKIIFSFRMQSKYTLKRINYDMFSQKKIPGAITNLITNE